jgi:hypothetical protein
MAIVLFQLGIAVLVALSVTSLRRPPLALLALALILAEAVYNAPHLSRATAEPRDADIAAFLHAQPGWFRVEFDDADVPFNFGDLYAIEQFGGAVSSMPLRVHSSLGNQETPRIYGIRYRVARLPSGPAQLSVFTSRSGLHVWRDSRIADPIATWRTAPCNAPDQFRIVSRTPERLVLDVVLPCPALVRVGDSFYPGWRSRPYRNSMASAPSPSPPAPTASNSSTAPPLSIGVSPSRSWDSSPRCCFRDPVVRST